MTTIGQYEDEANSIIRRSYEKSYAHIIPCDDDFPATTTNPSSGKACMKKTLDYFNTPNPDGNSTIPSIPWWFQTLLRDIQTNGAYGSWHHFYTTMPPLNFCTIGKVGTTEWRKIFCRLNDDDCIADPKACGKKQCVWRTTKQMPEGAPWAVFLRDPLERLLSGFLNKCHTPLQRRRENHCEPNFVFNPLTETTDGKNIQAPSLIEHLDDKDKQFFAAYVDVLPLKWNLHFIPQAIACDLYRNIGSYDFVGNMGEDFMSDLERMANQFGGQLPEALNTSFGYQKYLNSGEKNTGKDKKYKTGHATHAPEKVKKFYTAQTVRKGLELLSIDYVLLGLEVPEWARQMLRDDVS